MTHDQIDVQVIKHSNGGRNNDTSNMKDKLHDILSSRAAKLGQNLGLPEKTISKHDYGFHNYTMGRLLCPSNLAWNNQYVYFLLWYVC